MNQKELTGTFMMISNLKKKLWPTLFSQNNSALQGLKGDCDKVNPKREPVVAYWYI